THAAETIVEREMVLRTTGLEEIAYLDSVGIAGPRAALAHCVWVDQHEIARLAAQGTNVVHCPSSNLKLGSGVARIPEMLQAGCPVVLDGELLTMSLGEILREAGRCAAELRRRAGLA